MPFLTDILIAGAVVGDGYCTRTETMFQQIY